MVVFNAMHLAVFECVCVCTLDVCCGEHSKNAGAQRGENVSHTYQIFNATERYRERTTQQ